MKRVIFFQFSNVAAYPPAINAIEMLMESGIDVVIVGLSPASTNGVEFPEKLKNTKKYLIQRSPFHWTISYVEFFTILTRLFMCGNRRHLVAYGCDSYSTPALNVARILGIKSVYHEHDSPDVSDSNTNLRFAFFMKQRRLSLAKANVIVFPNKNRFEAWQQKLNLLRNDVQFIYNSPRKYNWYSCRDVKRDESVIILHYHGNISNKYLPIKWLDVLQKLPKNYRLSVVGYEAQNEQGYMSKFLATALDMNLGERVTFEGPMSREALGDYLRRVHIGIGVMPYGMEENFNELHLFPASNKLWDYLCSRLPVILDEKHIESVPQDLHPGLISCDSNSTDSIISAIMGRSIAKLPENIMDDYCFEARFSSVVAIVK